METVQRSGMSDRMSREVAKPVLLEIDSGVAPRRATGSHDRPWRKSAEAVREERRVIRELLGPTSGGVDLGAVHTVLAVRELLEKEAGDGSYGLIEVAATALLQVATNASPESEVASARASLLSAVKDAELSDSLARWEQRLRARRGDGGSASMKKLQLMHEVPTPPKRSHDLRYPVLKR